MTEKLPPCRMCRYGADQVEDRASCSNPECDAYNSWYSKRSWQTLMAPAPHLVPAKEELHTLAEAFDALAEEDPPRVGLAVVGDTTMWVTLHRGGGMVLEDGGAICLCAEDLGKAWRIDRSGKK